MILKIGDIGMLRTADGILPKAVQHFQMQEDAESGRYNHTFRVFDIINGVVYILEAAVKEFDTNKGRTLKASAVINPLSNYTDHPDKYKIQWLTPIVPYNEDEVKVAMMRREGTPYDKPLLLRDAIIYYRFGLWLGRRKRNAWRQVACHELTMLVDNDLNGWFKNWNKGRIKDIYHSKNHVGV